MKDPNIDVTLDWIHRPGDIVGPPSGVRWLLVALAAAVLFAYAVHCVRRHARSGEDLDDILGVGTLLVLAVAALLVGVAFMTFNVPIDYGSDRTTLVERCPDGCRAQAHDITGPDAILRATGVPVSVVRPVQAPPDQDRMPEEGIDQFVDDLNGRGRVTDPDRVWDAIKDKGSTRVVVVGRQPVVVVIDWVDGRGAVHHDGTMEVRPDGRISLYDAHHRAIPRQDPDAVLAHAADPGRLTVGGHDTRYSPGRDKPWRTAVGTGETMHTVDVHTIGGHLWLSDAVTGEVVDLPGR